MSDDEITALLSWDEFEFAGLVGVKRHVTARREQRPHFYGADDNDGVNPDVRGAAGEMAFAKWSNRYWMPWTSGDLQLLEGDVGRVGVRTRPSGKKPPRDHLLLHPDDPDSVPFVFVQGPSYEPEGARFTLVGWVHGAEGKKKEYWGDKFGTGRPCFWTPIPALKPMPSLRWVA